MTSKLGIRIRRYIIVKNYIESKNIKRRFTNNMDELRRRLMSQSKHC